jgi:hypothetical protein
MEVAISGHQSQKITAIQEAAQKEWSFEDWCECEDEWLSDGEGNLCDGESEEEFVTRLSKAVWRVNGAFCKVDVLPVYLKLLPVEDYCLDQQDYERLMKPEETAKNDL